MIRWAGAERPAEQPVALADRPVVYARLAAAHQPRRIELPLLVAVRPIPVLGIVVPFILETHGDTVVGDRPEFLDQAVIEFPGPFAPQELNDRRPALKKFGAIAPATVFAIGERDPFGIARVPGILGHPHLLHGRLDGERRQGSPDHRLSFVISVALSVEYRERRCPSTRR